MATLVVVSGAPATGKTTLARELGSRLGLVVLGKDALKEALADAVGMPADVAASARLGAAAYAALFTLARELLAGDVGVIVESNFRRDNSEMELAGVATVATSVHLIHCTAPADLIVQRYGARLRHAAHLDEHRHDAIRADLTAGRYEPLRVDWPSIVVDTGSSSHVPSAEQVADIVAMGK